jgi:hypothetical protein
MSGAPPPAMKMSYTDPNTTKCDPTRSLAMLVGDGVARTVLAEAQDVARSGLVLHVVDPRADIDERFQHRVARHIFHALAIDVHLAVVADGIEVLLAGSNHGVLQ